LRPFKKFNFHPLYLQLSLLSASTFRAQHWGDSEAEHHSDPDFAVGVAIAVFGGE
jgi:hypothetical protein